MSSSCEDIFSTAASISVTAEQVNDRLNIARKNERTLLADLRQPATHWTALSARPWMATSIANVWSFRWHQFFRNALRRVGARPGGALLGKPGALFGASGVSALICYVELWGLERGT
jgi:hypothetical protein